jgi:hypothetical protein
LPLYFVLAFHCEFGYHARGQCPRNHEAEEGCLHSLFFSSAKEEFVNNADIATDWMSRKSAFMKVSTDKPTCPQLWVTPLLAGSTLTVMRGLPILLTTPRQKAY